MKITALEVEGFGVWSGLRLDPLADGLNVFYGPNEAGKSTLLEFIRAILYGFSPPRRRYLPSVHGGRPGGTLHLLGPGGVCQASRFFSPGEADARGQFLLRSPDGARHGEAQLEALLCNLEERVFNNVFAVGLHELQELATLNDTEAAAYLYKLTAGMDRVSLVEVLREVGASRNRLIDPSGAPALVDQLAAQRDRLRSELQDLGELSHRYGRLAAERAQAQREAARLEEERQDLAQKFRTVEIALAVRDRHEQRKTVEQQLAAIGSIEKLPPGAAERLEKLRSAIDAQQQQVDGCKAQQAQLTREAREIAINRPLLRQAPRIEVLKEQQAWIGTLGQRLKELESEITEDEERLRGVQEQYGLDGQELPLLSPQSLAALRRPAAAVRRCRLELEDARRHVEDSSTAAQGLEEEIGSALDAKGERQLNAATERAGAEVGLLRRRVQIDERLEQLERNFAELEERSQDLLDHQMMPLSLLLAVGAVFVVGAALVMLSAVGLVFTHSLLGQLGWPAAIIGLGATIAAVVLKISLEKSNARKLENCQRQLRMLHAQRKQAKEERTSLDRQLPPGEGPVLARLQAAERELAGLEELVPMEARRQAARQEAESSASRVEQSEQELAVAVRRWKEAAAAAGLPKGISPRQVRRLAAERGDLEELQARLARRREERAQRSGELQAITARVAQLVNETGVGRQVQDPAEQLRKLLDEAAEQESRRKRRRALRQQFVQLRRQRAGWAARLARLKRRRRALLAEIGVEDEDQLRQHLLRQAEAASLEDRRASLAREIAAAIAGHCPETAVVELLDGPDADRLPPQRDELQRRLEDCSAHLKERYEQSGQLGEQLKTLAENRSPGLKRLELGAVEVRLAEAIDRWKTLAVTSAVLEDVRKVYEKTRQPETLQETSGYLHALTQGRYRRVWTPLSDDVLLVDDAEGKPLSVDLLSRGAREQLFLCLRLALVSSYARRGIALPMILDDVLVNFDSHRAKAAAAVLRDFAAAGHQLLVFTCHEHVAQWFQALEVPVHELPDHAAKSPLRLPPSSPTKAKRRRKPAAEERRAPVEPPHAVEIAPQPAEPPREEPRAPQPPEPLPELPRWEADDGDPLDQADDSDLPTALNQDWADDEVGEENLFAYQGDSADGQPVSDRQPFDRTLAGHAQENDVAGNLEEEPEEDLEDREAEREPSVLDVEAFDRALADEAAEDEEDAEDEETEEEDSEEDDEDLDEDFGDEQEEEQEDFGDDGEDDDDEDDDDEDEDDALDEDALDEDAEDEEEDAADAEAA